MYAGLAVVLVIIFFLSAALKVLNEYERGVIFRLGRIIAAKGPGLIILIPIIDRIVKVSLRLVALDVDPQDVITRDNVSVKVNAVLYFRVVDPVKAIVQVENYAYAMSQLAQTTLRSVCGQAELDDLLAERDKINAKLQEILDTHTDPWGIKVTTVELKQIDLPQEMQRAIARQAEAERERRAKVINCSCATCRPCGKWRRRATRRRFSRYPWIFSSLFFRSRRRRKRPDITGRPQRCDRPASSLLTG